MADGRADSSAQRQTILNLYNSGIEPEIIAAQLDISQEQVDRVIAGFAQEEQKRQAEAQQVVSAPSFSSFYLDKVVDTDAAVKQAQERVWRALKFDPDLDLMSEETQAILAKFVKSKVAFVILHIDLVGSTRMSSTLPPDRLANIVQAFTQEMSTVITAFGGYVLKYIGDAIMAFFLADWDNLSVPCSNAVACAHAMVKVMRQGINPILNQYDYPELNVRVGIDVGDNVVVQYGWDTTTLEDGKVIRRPHMDILGYTISITAKMTSLADADQIVVGQFVYEALCSEQQASYKPLSVSPEVWGYMSDHTGKIYQLYGSI
jgi:class 3 adenylate cyclase